MDYFPFLLNLLTPNFLRFLQASLRRTSHLLMLCWMWDQFFIQHPSLQLVILLLWWSRSFCVKSRHQIIR